MKKLAILAFAGMGMPLLGQMKPGVAPRPNPTDYAASQQTRAGTFAGSLIPTDQVKHIFAVDISKTYLVFEVACYPAAGSDVNINPDDFLVKAETKGEYTHPAAPVTVMAVLAHKDLPKLPSNSDVNVGVATTVGYETGTDPYTGRREHGTYTDTAVGVAKGVGGPPPYPVATPDFDDLEAQLNQRALPPGKISAPVAGFLYFPARELKKNSDGKYTLEYMGDQGTRATLEIPTKTHK